ncbi:major facilitator superfamily domain-containing protein [Delphinella strobiligena]|nr:major facilitator superfamily domain-containing protein [Delphinella strobiligena]
MATVVDTEFNDGAQSIALRSLHSSAAFEEDSISLPRPWQPAHIQHVTETEEGFPNTQNEEQEEHRYPHGLALIILFVSACSSLLLTELDNQILATAVPAITDSFGSIADVGWYSSAYRLSICSFQFMFGKLYRTLPLKRVFLASLFIFEIGSAVCGSAQQILTVCFPLRYRPAIGGLAAGIEGCSSVAAPLIGGLITENLNWRWCFLINLPFGGVALILLMISLQNPPTRPTNADLPWKDKIKQLDPLGTAVFLPAVTCLFIGLEYGAVEYGYSNARVVTLFLVSGGLLVAFGWIQWKRQDNATLPPRILRQRSILAGFLFSLCTNSALNVVRYVLHLNFLLTYREQLPTYFQIVQQMSPGKAGLMMMPMLGGFILSMLFAGSAVSLVGFYVPFMLVASVMMPIASGLLTTLKGDGSIWRLFVYEVLFGLGAGIGFQSPQAAVQTTLSDADVSMGLNIIVFAQNFGPALFVNVAQSVFSRRLVSNLKEYAPEIDGSALESIGWRDIKTLIPAGDLQEALLGYDKAITQTFYLSVALTSLMIVGSLGMEWRSVKEKKT